MPGAEHSFEDIKKVDDQGNDYWKARELRHVMHFATWQAFEVAIERAKKACEVSNQPMENHFSALTNMVVIGSNSQRSTKDYKLSRYACYLIAQNGDPRMNEWVAKAQTYFALQTRNQELSLEKQKALERVGAREKLKATEVRFAGVVMDRGVDQKGIATIRGAGDQALFGGYNTEAMKRQLGIKERKPLADHLPTVTLKAKDLATEMTTVKTLEKDLRLSDPIKQEHIDNNRAVRKALADRGIRPEALPPEEDILKVQRRIKSENKKLLIPAPSEKKL